MTVSQNNAMVWNEFFLCHSLCKNFLFTGWVKILFLWVHNHMSSKFCFSLLTYLSSSHTTTVPELKSELLISTWTLLNHRCSALATLWTWTALDWNWPPQNLTSVPLVGTQQASDLSPPWTLGLFLRSQFVRSVSQISGLFQLLKVAPSCL